MFGIWAFAANKCEKYATVCGARIRTQDLKNHITTRPGLQPNCFNCFYCLLISFLLFNLHQSNVFKKWANLDLFLFIFGLWTQTSLQFSQEILVKKCSSSLRCRDSNPRPWELLHPHLMYFYRSFDGSCNNLKSTKFGMRGTPFQRILENDYADGELFWRQT